MKNKVNDLHLGIALALDLTVLDENTSTSNTTLEPLNGVLIAQIGVANLTAHLVNDADELLIAMLVVARLLLHGTSGRSAHGKTRLLQLSRGRQCWAAHVVLCCRRRRCRHLRRCGRRGCCCWL